MTPDISTMLNRIRTRPSVTDAFTPAERSDAPEATTVAAGSVATDTSPVGAGQGSETGIGMAVAYVWPWTLRPTPYEGKTSVRLAADVDSRWAEMRAEAAKLRGDLFLSRARRVELEVEHTAALAANDAEVARLTMIVERLRDLVPNDVDAVEEVVGKEPE